MMLVFTYDDGEKIATVTWTREYGFIAAGDHEILDRMKYEEREPRVARVVGETNTERPVPIIGIDPADLPDDEPTQGEPCASCGYPEARHDENPYGCRSYA